MGFEAGCFYFPRCKELQINGQDQQTMKQKSVVCFLVYLLVLFLFLFSVGLSFIPEFILNLIWFYNESSILHVSTKHLVYFLFENDTAEV